METGIFAQRIQSYEPGLNMLCEGGHPGSGAGRTLLLLCLEVLSQGAPLYTRPSGTRCVCGGRGGLALQNSGYNKGMCHMT